MEVGPGTRVVVTGASRGIGRATCEAFARRGCTIGLLARSEDELRQLVEELPGSGHQPLPADVGDRASVESALARFGDCDVLVANAGIARYGPFLRQDVELAEEMTRINWLGTVYTLHAGLPRMVERGTGHAVVVSSGAGYRAFPEAAVYGGTKAAQRAFAEALRHELAGTGVSLSLVYPGEVASSFHAGREDSMPSWYSGDRAPAGPLGERIVRAVERDEAAVHYPSFVRALRVVHGISPRLADTVLRRARGGSLAPRR